MTAVRLGDEGGLCVYVYYVLYRLNFKLNKLTFNDYFFILQSETLNLLRVRILESLNCKTGAHSPPPDRFREGRSPPPPIPRTSAPLVKVNTTFIKHKV